MTRVRSSSVVAVGYDEERHELWLRYVSGETYVYAMVPWSVHRELLAADSVGRFVNTRVKPSYPVRASDGNLSPTAAWPVGRPAAPAG